MEKPNLGHHIPPPAKIKGTSRGKSKIKQVKYFMTPSHGVCSKLCQEQWNDFPFCVMGKHDVFSPRR